jgi:hypothetical protein
VLLSGINQDVLGDKHIMSFSPSHNCTACLMLLLLLLLLLRAGAAVRHQSSRVG